jgi:hypothetical protein
MENVNMADTGRGIRGYGPGKFNSLLDSWAHTTALDGVDEEVSIDDGGGWYGLIRINRPFRSAVKAEAKQENEKLNAAEKELLDTSAAVIFFERSDGIVETDWYENLEEAEQAWAEIENDVNGSDDDDSEFDDDNYDEDGSPLDDEDD